MSTIVTENLKRSSETASRSLRGVAAAWLNMNGTGTVAIRDSQNHSSVTDSGVGSYQSNLAAAMNDTNYSIVALATFTAGPYISGHNTGAPQTVSTYTNVSASTGGGGVDSSVMTSHAHGDLA